MSLAYNVVTLVREPIGSVREHAVDSRLLISDEPSHGRVIGHAMFLRTKDGVLVEAKLEGLQHDRCSRCLKEMDVPLEITIQEEFLVSIDAHTGAALPPPDDPETFRIDATHILNLEEAVRQSWTSALPMQPLCRPDCAGLCPNCGQDLNQSACSCAPESDDHWSALHKLAQEMKGP